MTSISCQDPQWYFYSQLNSTLLFFLTAICDYKRRKTEPVIKNLLSSLFLTFIPIPAKFVNWFQRVYENLTFGSDCLHEFYIAYSVDNHVLLLSQRHNINIIHYNLFAAYWRVKKEKLVRRKRCLWSILASTSHFLKVLLIPLHFLKRPTLVTVFANQKKSEKVIRFYKKRQKWK